jgi:hypothetical protein
MSKQWHECMICSNLTKDDSALCTEDCRKTYHRTVTTRKDNHVSDRMTTDHHLAQFILLSTECHIGQKNY